MIIISCNACDDRQCRTYATFFRHNSAMREPKRKMRLTFKRIICLNRITVPSSANLKKTDD